MRTRFGTAAWWGVASGMMLAIVFVGCGSPTESHLRIGLNPWPGYEFLFLAEEKGFFAAHGVDVRLIEYSSLGDVLRAFNRGQVDGMAATLVEVLQAHDDQTKRSPRVFLVTDFSHGADVILARGEIDSIAGLRGKRVAAETGSLSTFLLARALEREGMPLSAVGIVPTDQTNMAKSLDLGAVDAVVSYPPASIEIMRSPDIRTLFSSADIPGEVMDVLALAGNVLERRPEDAAHIIRAWDDALAYAEEHPAETHQLMASRERITVEEFRQVLAGIRVLGSSEQAALFEAGGALTKAVDTTVALLHESRQLDRRSSAGDCLAPGPLAIARRGGCRSDSPVAGPLSGQRWCCRWSPWARLSG